MCAAAAFGLAIALALVGCGRVGFSVAADGAMDAVSDDDGGVRYCATLDPAPELCADFDTGAPVVMGFDDINRTPVGATTSVLLDPLAFSGSSAAKVSLNEADSCSYARLVRNFQSSGEGLSVRFRMRLSAPWPDDHIFANVHFGDTTRCGLLPRLRSSGAGATLQVQWGMPEQNSFYDWSRAPTIDAWSLVEMAIMEVAGTPQIHVRVDGHPALTADLPQCAFGGDAFIGLGSYCASGTRETRYDDIVVDHP